MHKSAHNVQRLAQPSDATSGGLLIDSDADPLNLRTELWPAANHVVEIALQESPAFIMFQ